MNKNLLNCAALLVLSLPLASLAETIEIPLGQQGHTGIAMPQRGQLKSAVLERFGLPDEEHPAVGKPPITRWDYREFSVYFEYDHVVDSVLNHQPHKEQP
ncbi:phosphodiesterase [Pseudomonas sp. LRF_L74]|uniref:phosphodiesterase n=1 Tax=Pseudomonas sp. LRF_L74 TaxID=3369422 RepID=UPI003F5F5E4A